MREEILCELRNVVRLCKFDFKLAAQHLIAYCDQRGYDARGVTEKSVREAFTEDFIAYTSPDVNEDEKHSPAPESELQNTNEETAPSMTPVMNNEEESEHILEEAIEETLGDDDEKLVLAEIDQAIPSTALSIIDLIECEGFDEFLAEVEAELDLQADPKTDEGPSELAEVIAYLDRVALI